MTAPELTPLEAEVARLLKGTGVPDALVPTLAAAIGASWHDLALSSHLKPAKPTYRGKAITDHALGTLRRALEKPQQEAA